MPDPSYIGSISYPSMELLHALVRKTIPSRKGVPERISASWLQYCRPAGEAYAKAMSRLDSSGQFQLGADRFKWRVKHYGGEVAVNTHVRGISARVCLAGENTRELVIEFDAQDYPPKRPAAPAQLAIRIQEFTAKAIEAGWRPESRGKPFYFVADPLNQ